MCSTIGIAISTLLTIPLLVTLGLFTSVHAQAADTIGLHDSTTSTFYLCNENAGGPAHETFRYGPVGRSWQPLSGDWNGDGRMTVGLYNPATGTFYLRNAHAGGKADEVFRYGPVGRSWQPLSGDWNGDERMTVGLYDPATGTFYLRNENAGGKADEVFRYGPVGLGWQPLSGDWNGDERTTVGLYDAATGTFYLRNAHAGGKADETFRYGPSGRDWQPLSGDWNNDGRTTVGLYGLTTGTFYLRNAHAGGKADVAFRYGPQGRDWQPLSGDWDGSGGKGPYTLRGTVLAFSSAAMDTDVNDPNAFFAGNDTLSLAQAIANPAQVGGYLNEPFAGAQGRSFASGDSEDWYRVAMQAQQKITLFVADNSPSNDLDLYVYDSEGNLVDASVGLQTTESLVIAGPGTYFIQVIVAAGASNYVLTIGQDSPASVPPLDEMGSLRLSDNFVPDEVVVRFQENRLLLNDINTLAVHAPFLGLQPTGGNPQRNMRFKLGDVQARAQTFQALKADALYARLNAIPGFTAPGLRSKLETLWTVKRLRQRPDVRAADTNRIRYPLLVPDDPFYPSQWHYRLINLPQAWDVITGAPDVIVAVLDTGVLRSHPDLQNQLMPGYDFISDPFRARDGDGIDANPEDVGDLFFTVASSFHGTHVAGTVAAAADNGVGVAGIAWQSKIMPLRVLGLGGATDYDIEQALRYAARLPNDSNTLPAQRADIINLSLGGPGFSQTAQELFTTLRNQGIIIVAAAGNNDSSTLFYPASYDGVISVSAVDSNKVKAPYSNFGSRVDVAAPGGDISKDWNGDGFADGILSTLGDDSGGETVIFDYGFLQGTSMAAPHMAGVAALMKARYPALTPQELDNLLAGGSITEDLGNPGRDAVYGHGLIDAHRAVIQVGEETLPPTPVLVADPAALNFGLNLSTATLQLDNSGNGTLTVESLTEDSGGWLKLTSANIADNGLGAYTIRVNRSGLASGGYRATITVMSTANTVTVPVIMEVGSVGAAADAGYHYVLLIDPATSATRYQVAVGVSDGSYPFTFNDVTAGEYRLIAGTDSDNDGLLCDAGEACGAYPTLDVSKSATLTVSGNRIGLDFTTGFDSSITAATGAAEPGMNLGIRAVRRLWQERLPVQKNLAPRD